MAVRVLDEALTGSRSELFELDLGELVITAKTLIEARVHEEWRRTAESGSPPKPLGLGQRRFAEQNVAEWVQAACTAFEQGQFLLLVDAHQIQRLDEPIALKETSDAVFIRLTPLVGG